MPQKRIRKEFRNQSEPIDSLGFDLSLSGVDFCDFFIVTQPHFYSSAREPGGTVLVVGRIFFKVAGSKRREKGARPNSLA